ncbi:MULTISPECIES: hypothetical protein [Stappia]|uniref:NADH dehydrogenase subunit H n=1 Tax=Stappia taiwanensis TaxID=992267 RepID=A0A838Y2X8_9HYPH|nr:MULTISPECIES: hypothetical protein [Stappia]MBA4613250.1 hypothetical protein [Stappia taiwanensis]MCA1296929.1 hypothetical protein [Stappia indica]GGE80601.1 hypothetical protein GCM10007285_05380 [Stappia taiwanensis]
MSISIAGLIGAALGLYIGWIDYKIMVGVLRGAAEKNSQGAGRKGWLARYEAPLRWLLLALTLIGFPVIGYLAAHSLVG